MNTHKHATLLAASLAAALLIPAVALQAAAPPTAQGVITVKEFLNMGGTTLPDLTNNARFPNNPDLEFHPPRFEWPTGPDDVTPPAGDIKNDYGVQVIGYFYPPANGQYRFAIAADDNAALYLSTDSNPANKVQLAIEAGWNPVRNWDGQANGRALVDVGTPDERWNNQSKPIALTAGQAYYIEALMKEGGGGDNVAVAYRNDGIWPAAGDLPIPGSQLSTIDKTTGPVSVATHPQSQTVLEGTALTTFRVTANGTPPYGYQWKKGGVDIFDATNWTYSIQFVTAADAGPYTVTVSGATGAPVTSNPAVLTVTADTTPPTLVSAVGGSSSSSPLGGATVVFSERMDAVTAGTAGNYTVSGGVTVSGVIVLNDTTVVVRTSTQVPGTLYTLTVNNVRDRAAVPNAIAANSVIQFNSASALPATVQFQVWNGGIAIGTLTNNLADGDFGRAPDNSFTRTLFESGRDFAENYGARGYGWFRAPASGDYVFYTTVDDNARLYLSTDDNPANKKTIAAEATWSNNRDWTPAIGTEQASDTYTDTEWPTGNTITLVQNQYYYLEVQWQEGGGGDGVEVTYKLSTEADPVSGEASRVAGTNIVLFADPATRPPEITRRPTGTNFNKGDTLTFSVDVVSPKPVTYQWYRSKQAIAGATNNPLVIPNADHTAIGDYYVDATSVNGAASSFPDDVARAIMNGAFLIEAEDFNFGGGQTTNVASVMPYTGNAYDSVISQVVDVDYFNTADESGGAAFGYTRFNVADPAVVDMKGGLANEAADPIQNANNRNRGSFSVTANFAVGWTDAGEWQNYTRTFPTGNYVIYGGVAYDGRAANQINMYLSLVGTNNIPDGSQPGIEGGQQGLTRLGTFVAPATGAWSSNDIIPLRDTGGNIAQVALSGTKTIRWTANKADGDMDFLLFYPVVAGPVITSVSITGGSITVVWTGGGTLFSTPVLNPPSTWTTTGDSDGSFTAAVGAGNLFFRVQQ